MSAFSTRGLSSEGRKPTHSCACQNSCAISYIYLIADAETPAGRDRWTNYFMAPVLRSPLWATREAHKATAIPAGTLRRNLDLKTRTHLAPGISFQHGQIGLQVVNAGQDASPQSCCISSELFLQESVESLCVLQPNRLYNRRMGSPGDLQQHK